MEALLFLVIGAGVLLVPVGSLLGFLAFRQRDRHASRVEDLAREVADLRAEVSRLRDTGVSLPDPVTPATPDVPADVGYVREPASSVAETTDAETSREPVAEDTAIAVPVNRSDALVSRGAAAFKANWMVWIGALSVSLAGIFMVSHSISAGLIGPVHQLLMALLTGLGLHAGAEYLRRRHMGSDQVFAALAGGGSVTLYAALLAGVHHYGLIGPVPALFALALVSVATMFLALVHGPLLAIMGLSGAYLVPLLVGGEGGSAVFVLSYSVVITVSSLLLMQYVYRPWLWFGTLAGAGLWWLLVAVSGRHGLAVSCYLPVLFLLFSVLPGDGLLPLQRRRDALLATLLAWGASIAWQSTDDPAFLAWLWMLPVAVLLPQSRQRLWFLPWAAVLATFAGWLVYSADLSQDVLFRPLGQSVHQPFITYLILASVLVVLSVLWQWRTQLELRRWASLAMLAPVIWLLLGWLLVQGGQAAGNWALVALLAAAVYGVVAWRLEHSPGYRVGLVWAILAAHACYSMAVAMWLQEASMTLALATQFVSLVWLGRRYQAPELFLILKVLLAIVVARLTFNPWLQSYDAGGHWSLWTYGGATLFAGAATWLARKEVIRPWLEAVTLHLLVLFLGVELRYWLYNGDIFARQYGVTEASINTVLWGALSIVYVFRSRVAGTLGWLYRLLARALTVIAVLSYLVVAVVHNPWWTDGTIGSTPVFNLLLLAYGAPVLLALASARYSDLVPVRWALCAAAVAFGVFTLLEIRHLWQGSAMTLSSGMGEGELYTYSVIGMLYSIAAILWSTGNQSELLHKAGMILLGLVIGKIFLVDMAGLQGLWRVAAFMGLGLALLGLAWMYRRTSGSGKASES
ncbi:DUF2339 domain-containing protein [Marinobacter nauticus]|uniref:DUF2339 domain-containing protein n=1 Tax=Marinobacter nauticus TaxID=2743 RepID=UPI003515DBA5